MKMPDGPKYQKSAREWHESEPDWDQEAHEADLEAAKRRVAERERE